MIVGNATQGLPIFLTMARDQDVTWIVMFTSDPKLHPQFKPWGHGTKSYANSNSVMIGGSTMKISVTIHFNKIKHNSKTMFHVKATMCMAHSFACLSLIF